MRTLVAGLILSCSLLLLGCSPPPPLDWEDSSQILTIIVESRPSGAGVYGLSGENIGTLIGTTPIELKYWSDGDSWSCICGPTVEGTLEYWKKERLLGGSEAHVAFKCTVVEDGYKPHRIYEVLQEEKTTPIFGDIFVSYASFKGVRRVYTAVLEPMIAAPTTPTQQQQQQQQTVIVPGLGSGNAEAFGTILLSADVDNAEVYVDGMFVGNSPSTLKLSAGIHVVEVKATGYQPYKKELRVLANSELSLRAQLKQ